MKQRFDPAQPHQLAAIDAVLQRFPDPDPQLTVEMETGTGKTYTYLRTALELHRRHGLDRFVIVVPSVAIREGVLQQIEATRHHLEALYGPPSFDAWVHHVTRLARLRGFARPSPQPQLLVITLDAFNKEKNRIRRPDDRLGGAAPLEAIRAAHPVVLLDEPQSMSTPKARAAIASLNPRVVLRYSATHRSREGLVHRLGPSEAFAQRLVKRIEVDSADTPEARIRRTVRAHLARERFLAERYPTRPMKVLSLFFLDRVDGYVGEGRWLRTFEQACRDEGLEPDGLHAGYFAAVGGVAKDTRGQSRADGEVYDLILRDKARLLSPDEPVRFVWSHSALREGWDNPNVFQICTLNATKSTVKKRQELGRGIRLPLFADGERCHDPDVNVLTVVANEAYDDFARALQVETRAETGSGLHEGAVLPWDPTRVTLDPVLAPWWENVRGRLRHRLRSPPGPSVDVTLTREGDTWWMEPRREHLGRLVPLPDWFRVPTPLGDLRPSHAVMAEDAVSFVRQR